MNAKRGTAGLRGWRGLACLAIVGVLGLPGLAKASPGCQALNGQSGTIAGYGYVQLLSNSQQVNQGDLVTLTTPGQILYGGSFLQMTANGNTVSGTEGGSGSGADNLSNNSSSSTTYSITCTSAGATISGVSPSAATAGSTVTISGNGFWGTSQVLFGATPATSFTVVYGVTSTIQASVPNGSGTVTITVVTDAGTYTGGSFTFTPPTANPVSATVAYGSSNNAIPLSISGTATAVAVASAPAHGSATANGTSITYTPVVGYTGSDSFTYTASNAAGTSSTAQASITVSQATQTIAFANPGAQNFGATPTLTASANSGLPVSFTSSTTAVCTITSGGALTTVSPGTCTINANQAGNSVYSAALPVSQSFAIFGVVPGAPTIGTATAGNAQVTVNFTPPASDGGEPITQYTATSSPGGLTGACAISPCVVTGLINGTAYTFTVTATNAAGTGVPSAASGSTTPEQTQTITFANPGAQNFGTTPTLTASASSGLPVTFTSSTTAVCTITSGGTLTFLTAGSCTINANQAGNPTYAPAPQVSQTFAVNGIVPGAPTIGTATASDAQATVTFTPPTVTGGDPVTGYTATSSPGGLAGTCANSPCTVTGLANGTAYTFTVTATSSAGTGAASAASNSVTPKVIGAITNFVANPAAPVFKPGGTFTVSATGTGSSSPLVFAVTNPAGSVCSIQGATVTTLSAGTCNLTANQAGDGSHVAAPQATLAVTISNPPLPVVSNVSVNTNYNTATSINLASAITAVDITAVTVATQPVHGTVSVSGETVTYTPSSNFYGGTDSFTYTATNPGGVSTPATVTVAVIPLNVPTVQAINVSTTTGTPVLIAATAMASGPQPLTGATVASAPAHGTASANGEQITYTPAAGFVGTDSFTYRVANHFGSSAPATVTVQVTAAGRLGSAMGTMTLTAAPGTAVTVNLAQIVPDAYVSSVLTGLSPGSAGSITLSQPATLTFTSTAGFRGLLQISATLMAASGRQVTIEVLVLVSSQPDPSKNPDVLGLVNAQAEQAQRFAQSQLGNIDGRLESLHDGGGTALFSNTLAISVDGRALQAPRQGDPGNRGRVDRDESPFGTIARPGVGAAGGESSNAVQSEPSVGTRTKPAATSGSGPAGLGLWISGTANFGSFEAYRQASGFDSDDIAVNVGVDQRINPHALIGFSLGYNHDNADIASNGTRSIANGYSAALYGSYQPSAQTYVDLVLGGGGLDFGSRRYDADSGSFLNGRRNGSQWFGSLTVGYEYHNQTGLLLSPYLRLERSLSELNGFSEQGAVTAALSYGNQTVRTSLAVLGLRASEQLRLDWGTLVPRARLEIGHDFQGSGDTTLGYAFIPSAGSWNVLTNPYAANGTSVQLGLGLDLQLPRELRLTTDYGYLAQPHAHDQMIRFGLNKQF